MPLVRVALLVVVGAALSCAEHMSDASRPSTDTHDRLLAEARRMVLKNDELPARAKIQALLELEPECPHALSELAMLELGRGDLTAAEDATNRVRRSVPEAPEVRVLTELIRQRRAHPAGRWLESYREAWRLAGKPDLSKSDLLGSGAVGDLANDTDLTAKFQQARGDDRFFLALAMMQPTNDALDAIAERLPREENEGLALVALAKLGSGRGQHVRGEVLARLTEHQPSARHYRLLRLSDAGTDKPLSDGDVDELGQIAALPDPRRDLFERTYGALRAGFERAGIDGNDRAFAAALATIPNDPLYTVWKRLAASPHLRASQHLLAAEAIAAIATALVERPTILEKLVSTMILSDVAGQLKDPGRVEQARQAQQYWWSVLQRYKRLGLDNVRVAALAAEVRAAFAHDEAATMEWLGR